MKIAFFSSEVFPYAKTGGLGDVAGALPLALSRAGNEVKVFMPWYKNISPDRDLGSYGLSSLPGGAEIIFIKNDGFFQRDYLYNTPEGDYPDNLERFSFYCRKSLEIIKETEFNPDILHCNDWQSALVPVYFKALYKDEQGFGNTRTVLTIHNLAFQGYFPKEKFLLLGLPSEFLRHLEIYGQLNLLKAGIIISDAVNTVSPTYSRQIQTKEFGCGLEDILRRNRHKLEGILNAIDYNIWNPETDRFIYTNYNSGNLEAKVENKLAYQKEMGLAEDKNCLLLGMVSRLSEQKGIEVLIPALESVLPEVQVAILGLGDKKYHEALSVLAQRYPGSFSLHLKFDEGIAHKIYSASDVFLLPSRFEPCGLSQMISFKYAVLPLVNPTGGLADTVFDCLKNQKSGNGFVMDDYSAESLTKKIKEAEEFFQQRDSWAEVMKRVAELSFSWDDTSQKYLEMYKRLW